MACCWSTQREHPQLRDHAEAGIDAWADQYDVPNPLFNQQLKELGVSKDTLNDLIDFARTKAQGMRLRAAGNVLRAELCERVCEEIRSRLPGALS